MSRSSILLLLLLTWLTGIGQLSQEYHKSFYTTENGLPANGVKGMQWDEETGFLWIATEAGISRFNGIDFKNFTIANTPFISSERMAFMVKNNQGRIFTADQYGNIFSVSRNRLIYYGKKKKMDNGFYDKNFTLEASETLFTDTATYRSKIPSALNFDHVLPIGDEACYVVHNSLLYYFSKGMSSMILVKDSVRVRAGFIMNNKCFVVDANDRFCAVGELDGKLVVSSIYNPDGSEFRELSKDCRIFWNNGMAQPVLIKANRSWLLSMKGDKAIATPLSNEVPTDAFIYCVQYSPKKDILFLGTDSKGIIMLTKYRVDPMKRKETNSNDRNAYYSQIALPDGNVLTNEGHILGRAPVQPALAPIKGKFSFKTGLTGDSLIWYTQFNPAINGNSLFKYNKLSKNTTAFNKIRGSEIFVSQLSDGRYAATSEFGIGVIEGDSLRYVFRYPEINYNNESYNFTEIKPGELLMATCSGIIHFNIETGRSDTVLRSVGYCVRSLWRYQDYIFFGTYGKGIFIWKNGVLKPIPLDKRNYLLYAHCFQPDGDGYCWISTNRGLFKAKVDEMVNAYENGAASVYYHYFGKNDGMDITEMNGGCTPCALQLADKTLSFPTMDGLLWVNPAKAKPILPEGDIFIEDIIAEGKEIQPGNNSSFDLPAKTRDVSVSLAFPAWCGKENIYLEYQLNDTLNWKEVNTDNDATIHFNNLPAGKYTLRIRKLNGFGIGNYSYKSIGFNIPVPWYQQWWFDLLLLLLAVSLILLYVAYRTKRLRINQQRLEKLVAEKTNELLKKNEVLEKNDSIKTRLISIISHDIITPLKFLNAAGKNLLEKRKQMPEELQQETISEITTTSQELQFLSTNILNWIKYQNENRRMTRDPFNVHELVTQVFGVLNSMAKQKGITLVNDVPSDQQIIEYFEPLKIVVYNLVSNAINFTDKGSITVNSRIDNDRFYILVKDQGTGMSAEQIQHVKSDEFIISSVNVDKRKGNGLGYLIIKDLLKTMKGSFSIYSEKGKGTEVEIQLPLHTATNKS